MEWLEQNLDAYRILAGILNDLRIELRQELEKIHGSDWFRTGLPEEVFDRLVSSKEGATAIDWYETEYQQIMDFAVFPDFYEIIEHNSDHFPALLDVVPSPPMFQARFLELEVLRSKIGRARPISEGELSFLKTFHARFLKHLKLHRDTSENASSSSEATEEISIQPEDTQPAEVGSSTQKQKAPKRAVQVSPPADRKPPQRPATTMAGNQTEQPDIPKEANTSDDASIPAEASAPGAGTISQVVSSGNSTAILRELFKEVTTLAESLWSSDVPPPQTVWKEVRVSQWYEENFSDLSLKPLSDFYDVISHVEEKMETGLAKHDLQKMLEESNFAHVLLALRDMFQRNRI